MKIIPFKDCKIDTSILIDKEYPNAVFCQCGKTIHFKSYKSNESVIVCCPCCKSKILYN